jgi:hypothetical protein
MVGRRWLDLPVRVLQKLLHNRFILGRMQCTGGIDDHACWFYPSGCLSQQFSLKPYVQDAWAALQVPVQLDQASGMWIKTTPLSIGMTPLVTDGNTLRSKISVECHNDVTFGEKPAFRANSPSGVACGRIPCRPVPTELGSACNG